MSWRDVNAIIAVIGAAFIVIPLALTYIAARVGYKQVREFRAHTGDDSLLTSITGFSRSHYPRVHAPKAVQKETESASY
jgi:hypothetical protein